MNDMRSSHVEDLEPICSADSREKLEKLVSDERVDYYRDGQWSKNYRKGGPLEWYNPPYSADRTYRETRSSYPRYIDVENLRNV
jgi:hypothetical protein